MRFAQICANSNRLAAARAIEHDLAKVAVEGSNHLARSRLLRKGQPMPLRRGLQPAVKPVLAFPPAAPHLWSGRDRSRESGRGGIGMAYLPAAQRPLDVITPVVIYRPTRQRPSQVYVNVWCGAAAP